MTDGYAARFNTVAYDASTERLLDAVLLHPSTAIRARGGRRPGPGLEATVGGTPEAVTIAAGGGVIDDATRGSYRFVIPTPKSINLAARPGAGTSRIDLVVAKILNEDANPGDTLREVQIGLITGTAGASPAAPTVPSGQLQLARLDVPASGTIAISKPAPRMAAAGGTIIVADATEQGAIEQVYDGLLIYREDTDTFVGRVNGQWRTLYAAADAFTGTEVAWVGTAPPAGTRKLIKQGTVVVVTNTTGQWNFAWPGGAFPNGIVSVVTSSGDGAAFSGAVTPQVPSLSTLNGRTYPVANAASVRVNFIAIGW